MAKVLLVLLGLAFAAQVSADDPYVCANTCSYTEDQRPGIKYQPGQQYKYEYQGQVISKTRVTGDEESKMAFKADVILTARTECDHKLQVLNLVMEDVPEAESQWFKDAVEQYDMHYSYQDGWLEYLCPHEDEDIAATNFKRGILSAFQTTVTNTIDQKEIVVQESDVLGECETVYQVTGEGNLVFNKTKLNCRYNSYLPYMPHQQYTTAEGSTNLPFFSSDKNCKMELSDGVWKSVTCSEEIEVEAPFLGSTEASTMATVIVSSSLTLQAGPEAASGNFSNDGHRDRKVSIRMDLAGAVLSAEKRNSNITDISDQIEKIMAQFFDDATPIETRPYAFASLLDLMAKIQSYDDIREMWESTEKDKNRRQLITDVLLLCENQHCINLVIDLAQESPEVMTAGKVRTWLASSHFFTRIEPESVNITMELASDMPDMSSEVLMAVSTMVYRLCQQDPDNCREYARPFLEYVREAVEDSCGVMSMEEKEKEEIRTVFHAVANAGVLPYKNFPKKCFNKKVSSDLRVAAIQSFRRIGCPHDANSLWKILEDSKDEVEVRLAAYVALIPCAVHENRFFSRIEHLLKEEEVNQVGSYIWTHILNLVEQPAASSFHQELSRLAAHHTLQAKFSTNAFRSSRNYRYAHFTELTNMGGSVESNVIFTPNSYIPQHASVNLTLDILEKSINVFEMGGNFQGLEDYVERLFGRDGYFKHESIQTLLEHLRPKRDIREDKLMEFQRLYDKRYPRKEMSDEEEDEAKSRASLYFRIFGNEVFYVDNFVKTNPLQVLQHILKELTTPKSFKVIDQEYVSSTHLGFPLKLKLNATSSVTNNFTSSFEKKDDKHMVYEGKISASIAFAFDTTLAVDGYGAQSGLRHSSSRVIHTDFGGKLESKANLPLGFQLDLPKSDIAKVSSSVKVALFKNSEQKWQDEWPNVQVENSEYCSSELVGKLFGVKACSTSSSGSHTVGSEAFTGPPYKSEFNIAKTDDFKYYQFYYKKERDIFEAIFEAPGSVPRKIHFLVNLGSEGEGGYIVIRGIGYSLEGQYQNSEAVKELSLKYIKDSITQGGIEMSLKNITESIGYKYIPEFMLTIGPDVYSAMGNFAVRGQDVTGLRCSWELEGAHDKIEDRLNVGQSFGSVSGNLNLDDEKLAFQLHSEYGTERTDAHSLSLTLEAENKIEFGKKSSLGHFSIETSQGQSNLTLDYEYGRGNTQANASVTVMGKQVNSQVVVKNLADNKETDFQITLGLYSPQFEIDYLGEAIYKVAENGIQAEVGLNFGVDVHSRAALLFVFEDDPLHLLTGLHLSFNDYIIQAENSIDMSQPDKTFVTLSGNVGPAVGAFVLQAIHDHKSPFNASLDMYGKYEDQEIGLMTSTVSDGDWERFTGSTKLKWFDKDVTIKHEVHWNDDNKHLSITSESFGVLQLITRMTSKNPLIQFVLHSSEEKGETPDLQIAIGMNKESTYQFYQANVTAGTDVFFATTTNLTVDREFNTSLRLYSSELMIVGQYSRADYDDFEGSAEVRATLPSGDSYSANMAVNHTFDGSLRTFEIVSSYGEELIQGKLIALHRDGWFSDDSSGVNLTIITPFGGFRNFGFAYQLHPDLTTPNFAEVEWEQLKLHGLVHIDIPNNIEAALRYTDGGTCDSYFSVYHNHDGQQYSTGTILSLTQDMNPWAVEMNTTLNRDYYENLLEFAISFQSPIMDNPFEGTVMYNITSMTFDFEIEGGMEEKAVFSLSSLKKSDDHLNKFLGSAQFDSPWTDPVTLNISGNYDNEKINANFEFTSSLPTIHSFSVESSVNLVKPGEIKIHFLLTHDDVIALWALSQNLTSYGLVHKIEGSVNTVTVTYDFETTWDYFYAPVSASGHLALLNLMDHNLELSLSLKKAKGKFVSEVFGSWDDHTFKAGYTLDYSHPLKWKSDISVAIPGYDDVIIANISLNAINTFTNSDISMHITSPWTAEYELKFTSQASNDIVIYEVEILQATTHFLKVVLESHGLIDLPISDLDLKVTSALFDDIHLKWQHNVETEKLFFLESAYGTSFFVQGKSQLKFSDDWFNQDFIFYKLAANITVSEPHLSFDMSLNLNSDSKGDFTFHFNEYSVSFLSDIFSGTIFQTEIIISDDIYKAELAYAKGGRNLLSEVVFKIVHNDADVVTSKLKLNSYYPQFDASLSFMYATQDNSTSHSGDLEVSAQLDYNYGIKGIARLTTNLEGFENYSLSIDTDLVCKDNEWSSFFVGQLQLNDDVFGIGGNVSLVLVKKILFEFGGHYNVIYEGIQDMKDSRFFFSLTKEVCTIKVAFLSGYEVPSWELFLIYKINEKKIKGHVILGAQEKYSLSSRLDTKIFTLDAEIEKTNGTNFKLLQGNVNWIFKPEKQLILINMNSDYDLIKKVTGKLTIRGLAAHLDMKVNEEVFSAMLRLIEASSKNPGKMQIKIDNKVYHPFSAVIDVEFLYDKEGFKIDLNIEFSGEKDWITANLNFGLPQSYLRFKTPFEDIKSFNLTLVAQRDEDYNLTLTLDVPQFCFKLSGVLDHRYAFSSVNILIDLECSGATKFEFLVKYNLEQPLTFNTKLDLNGDIIFDIEIACTLKRGDIDFKMEGSILKEYSLGLTFKFSWKKEEDVIVNLQIYEPSSNNTFFRAENIFSSKRSSIQMELLQDNSITFETSYGVSTKPLKLMIDSNYSHSLFGHNINIQFGANGNATKKAGHLEVQMSSDTFYDHVNFTSKYNTKKDVLEALFHIATPTGNADINGTYQFTRTKVLTVDMLSSLHTFQDYHYEVVYKSDRNKSLKFVSAQDDIKFEFMGEILSAESQIIKLMLDTPYKAFKGLNITFGYPKDTRGDISYEFYMSVQSNGDYYIIDARPSHHHSWKSGNLEINCFSPYDALRNTTLFLVFDLNNHMAVGIEGRRGRLGLNGLWKQVRSGLNIRADLDMSYFGQGEFTLATEIPFDVYQTKLKLSRQKSNSDFVFQFGLGEAFRNGLFNLILIDMNPNAGNKTYSFSYNYNRKLNINGQFGPWEAMVGLELYGYPNSFMSGKFEINTNVQNYISIEGTWDISHRGSIYNAQLQVDINKKGLIILDGTFDTQANYAATPWDSVKLDILFESPFTLSHHIHAEYQLRILTFSASYQYGLDTFYINAGAIIHPTFGTVTFTGKIPVYGFSSFDLKVKYTLTDSKSSTLMISVEETVFETSFEVTARGLDGSFKLALSSPYFNPVSAKLTWSQSFSSVFLEINVSYGIVKGNAKMTLEYSDTFANFNLDIITPFDGASKVAVRAKYDIADVSKMFASLSLGVDLHSIDLKGDFTVRKEKASLNINGSLSFFGISGNFGIELKKNKDTYEISLNGNIAGLKPFTFDVSLDIYHLHFSWTYDAKKILLAAVDYENTNIIFNWDKYNYFNLTAYRQALKNGHEFGLKFVNQDEQTVSLYASYIFNKGHKLNLSINSSLTDPVVLRAVYTGNNININLSYGERVYNFSSKFIFNPNDSKGTITLNFDSTDDPQSTLVVNAFYDLRAFIQGDMKSTKNLTYFSFEWGEKVDFSLQGMRNPKQLKLHMDMKMPFKFLPKLRAGFEWELSSDVSEVHFGLKSYVEWSQKVAFAGQAKFARDMRYADIKGIITTPLSLFEEVAAGVVWKENRAEALISYNKAKWRLSCDYSLSPFSTNVILETPISGYETITFNAALADLSLKFELFFEFTWPEAKAVSLQISLERLKLEIGIITPWTPFKNVLLFASLMTESEEVVMSATLQWDERRASATVALSPLRYEVSGKYYFQAEEIAFAKGEVAILNREIQADAVIKTPLESLKLLNVSFHLDVIRSFSFKANLNDVECSIVGVFTPENMKVSGVAPFLWNLSWNLETKRSWEELRAYATFVPSETDNLVNVSFSYKYEYYPFSVKSVFEVKGDETLAYVELDLQEIWRVSVDVLGNTIDVKITVPSRDETNVYIHFESNDLELESCTLDIIGKYGKFWEFLNINSTLSFKIRDQFLSRHESVLLVTNDLRYFTADFELFSDYLSEPFHVKIKIPLFNVFTEEGVIELSQSSGGKVVYQLLYKTLLPSRWLIYREIVITTLDWTSSLSIELARDALKIMVSYPDAIKAHVLRLTWTDDLNPERFVLGVEVISPYLDKGQYKFDVRFSLRGKVHFKIESELIFGTKRTVLKGLLHYNRRQQEMRFETQLTSDWFGDHSADFSIDWERDILVNGKLQLLEVEHSLSITISIEDFMMDITLVSPFLAQKTILITAKLEQGESGYIVEGKYTDMENNFTLRGKLESYGINYYSASANVAHNGKDIFEMSSTFYAEDPLIKFKFGINSVVTELNTNVVFEYDDNARQRFMSFIFHNAYLLNEDIELSVVSDREWNRPQSLYFKYNHIYIELLSSFSDSNTRVTASVRYTYKTIHIEYSLEDFGKKADILIITPFTFLQKLQMSYDIESDDKYFYFKYRREDEPIEFSSHLSIDDVMGRAIGLELRTPFKGYEKFIIFSPQFNKNNDRNFIALLEYPGGKIGFSLIADVKSWYNTNMLVALYLPFEDYEVFSFQFVVTDPKYAVEARVGKFGFTFSIMVDVVADNDIIELKIRLNEYAFTLQLKQLALGYMTHRLEYGIHMDFKLHDLLFDINQFDFEVKYFVGERIQFLAKSDKEEYLNLHYGWNWHQVITIATPKWYPGYFHVNFESKDDLDDYRIELGLSPGILSDDQDYWDTYGFQVHQDILEGGRHLLLSVEGFGSQFSLEGAVAVTTLHLNKTLIFELNHRKLGYEILFQRQPGFLSDVYIEDVFLLFPNQTVHLNTSAETSSRQFDLNSRFTWNEHDIDMPPITLRVIYDDKSLLDQQDHHLMAIFRHPDIKEITFQGNVTKFFDASLNGLGEFIDYNVPEKNILLILNVDPVTHDEGQTIQLNLSQPYSNFSLNFDAQIIRSIFHQADYEFRYWSASKEKHEELFISTVSNSTENGSAFTIDILSPENDWGFSYDGSYFASESKAGFYVQEISKEYNDYWVFEVNLNRYLPQLEAMLHIGQENEDPFETGRIRVGMHNPLDMGAIIDHQRFGVWEKDGELGLNLKTKSFINYIFRDQDVLQFLLKYDPSLDYYDDDFLQRLFSPADQILDVWKRDMNSTLSALIDWGSQELPLLAEALVNQDTLDSIWSREDSNFEYLMTDFNTGIADTYDDVVTMWTSVLLPAWEASYNFVTEWYTFLLSYSEGVSTYINEVYTYVIDLLGGFLVESADFVIPYFDEWFSWFMQMLESHWNTIVERFSTLLEYLTSWFYESSDAIVSVVNSMTDQLLQAFTSFGSALQEFAVTIQTAIQPFFDNLTEAFNKYGEELSVAFTGKCWESIRSKADELVTTIQEMKDAGITFLTEFLQFDEFYTRFVQIKDAIAEWAVSLWSSIEDMLMTLQQYVTEHMLALSTSITDFVTYLEEYFSSLITQIETEGFAAHIQQKYLEASEYLNEQFEAVRDKVIAVLVEYLEAFKAYAANNIVFDYINVITGNAYDQLLLVWNRWRHEARTDLDTLERITFSLADWAEELLKERNYLRDELYVWEPEDYGKVEYSLPLPLKWKSFIDPPDWHPITRIFLKQSPAMAAERTLFEGVHTLAIGLGAFNMQGSMMPPFTGTATIFGQHVTTFDLHHYHFLGSCTYLLAKDFVGNEFEVVGDYKREDHGSIHLHSLTVRGPNMEVVLYVDGTIVIRNPGSAETQCRGDFCAVKMDDMFVTCNRQTRGCSITVSGKYFGRISGLLGNYNYEPSDDQVGPDGSRARHAAEMGRMWALSSDTCYQGNQVISVRNLHEAEEVDLCRRIFLSSSSPLSYCFVEVDPRPYFQHCIKDHGQADFGLSLYNTPCDAVAAYRTQCSSREIHLSVPNECQEATGSCNVFGRSVPSGWNTTFKGSTEGAADIAFVVDVAHCNRDKDLIKLLDGIDVEFEANGIVDARYALATSSQDNVGTITEFMKAAELAPDLRSLDMKGPPSKNGAAVAVIAAARNLKWRPGVSRTIIQLSCNPCDSAGVKRALRDNDITYHIISKGSISFGGSDAALSTNLRKKVFGYDEKFVYMAGDYQKLKGDADARGLLIDPEPSCMLTAQSTGGTVFSTFKWNPNKAKLEKKFLNVVAQRVAQSSVPPECQECRCGGRGTKAALMCRKCSTWLAEGGNVTQEEETLVEGMKRYFMNFYRGKIDPSDSSEPEKSTEKQPVPNGTTEASAPIFKDVTLPLPTAT